MKKTDEQQTQKQYVIPLEMTAETAADFNISPKDLRPIRIGARRARGIFVPVTKRVHDAYMRPLWRETKRAARHVDISLEALKEAHETEIPGAADVEEIAERNERAKAVRAALAKLPEKDRKILILFSEGATAAEMAKVFGLTERGIAYRRRAALERMRILLTGK